MDVQGVRLDVYSFSLGAGVTIVDFARAQGMLMRGRMLLLHHFRGEVYCGDVVNEAIADGPRYGAAGALVSDEGIPEYIERAVGPW